MFVCNCVSVYVCLCVYESGLKCWRRDKARALESGGATHTSVCMCVCNYVSVYVCMFVRVYVCMCVCSR